MSTHVRESPADERATGNGTCPHCGQTLLSEQAALQLRATELEAERKIEAAARALAAELAKEAIAEPEPGSVPEPAVHIAETEDAAELHDFRVVGRQF